MEKPPSIEKGPETKREKPTTPDPLTREELEEKFKFAKDTGRMMEASMYEQELKNFKESSSDLTRQELEERFKFAKDTGRMMEASMYEQELRDYKDSAEKQPSTSKSKEANQPNRFEKKLDSWTKKIETKTEKLREQRKQREQDWERSTRNSNVSELGVEREADVEKAWYMATIENLSQSQAAAYNDYLENPEAHLVGKRIEFSILKGLRISPEDLKREGERQAEITGQLYDKDKKITEYTEKKSRLGLLKEAVIGGVQTAGYLIKASYYDLPRIALKAWNKKDWRILLNGDRDFKNTFDKSCVGMYGLWAATESLFKLNKKEKRSMTIESALELEKVQERTGEYVIPKFTFHEQPMTETTGPDANSRASESLRMEISDKLFGWLEEEYRNYLKTDQAPLGFSDVFESFKSKDVKPEDIKVESKQMSKWLDSLSEWQTRVDLLKNKEKIQDEQVLNFFDLFLKLTSTEEKPKTDKARSIITPIIKMFLASKKLKEFSEQSAAA